MRTHPSRLIWLCLLSTALLTTSCFEDNKPPEGLRQTQKAAGPTVVFNLDDWPFPDIPFPNDLATVADETSPTGRRINVSMLGATEAESKVRRYLNRATGFGVFMPFSVRFDAPLDLQRIIERHRERVPDFSDDVVYLINVDPDSPEYGTAELIDMGRGNFPITAAEPDGYFRNDPRSEGISLLVETYAEEDLDGDGELDPIEDTDDDGVWDKPNTLDDTQSPYAPGNLLDFYERETNTLLMRPVYPLAPETTYAVVLTSDLIGEDGNPVQSPFASINHTRQSEDLEPLAEILPQIAPDRFTKDLDNVQFAWTLTTGSPTRELEAVRAGLYGHGSLGWLGDDFPAEFKMLHNPSGEGDQKPLTFNLDRLIPLLAPVASEALGSGGDMNALEDAISEIDYMVSGSFISPYFLADSDGLADAGADATLKVTNPGDDDETFDIDIAAGTARVRPGEVTFHCAVPAEQEGRKPPYPTIIYSHAIGSTRLEMIAFAGHMAKFGLATCTIDAAGHGLSIPAGIGNTLDRIAQNLNMPLLPDVLQHDRARDLDNDGEVETGEDYFVSDLLHSRDMMRQTTIDQMQLIRILRSFDGQSRWENTIDEEDPRIADKREFVAGWDQNGDGKGEIRGDFNGDGVVDFGGDQPYVAWGTSLGGLQTGILAGIEPTIRAAASNAGGGGLGDIATRTDIRNVQVGALLPMFGPLLSGTAQTDDEGNITGAMRLEWILPSGIDDRYVPFGTIEGVENGDMIVLRNLVRETREHIPEEERHAVVHVRNGRFRVGLAADADSAMTRRAKLGFDPSLDLVDDVMGCREEAVCGEEECADGSYCAPDGSCQPRSECRPNFDPSQLSEEDAKRFARHVADNPTEFGDALVIEIRAADGTLKKTIDTFPKDLIFENILYPKGAPLAALHLGWGLKRQTPRFRKFMAVSQMLLEVADPAVYAQHYFDKPLSYPYERGSYKSGWTNMLVVGTLGDQTVPINTGISLARAAGILDSFIEVDEYGTTENQFLVENYVYEGLWWLDRFPEYPNTLFDPDDLDLGQFISPRQPDNTDPNPDAEHPLRAQIETDHGISALRLPYLNTHGEHTFNVPRTDRGFGIATFMTNQVGWYLANYGQQMSDNPCMESLFMEECEFFDAESFARPELRTSD
ncbi:hypothetical protein FIV42_28655 [Persicimonas caeni]|uniref:SbsA Ig-like domain-containing protein n=1 Tax=Persicimonas caeni TaxID=2292766 RepID=A0A4Y6Q208_PERCE|nr:hypothetical protein [Persicimonas caeni]QDG54572.1 hypothetical protein FIV42_28655 [Persicimonas caeni]QED35793.1 hypothetical protein FRD00_28650 [Persicimonas caeni]